MAEGSGITRRAFAFLSMAPLVTAAASQEPFKITDNVDLVLVDVSVRSSHGEYVTDLPKDAFRVSVEGREQVISQFEMADSPVTIGLIVDSSGSMRYKRPEVVTAGLAFAKESNSQDEFFVVNFNNTVTPGLPKTLPFTDDIGELHKALFMGQPVGQTALYDAIAYGLKRLESGHLEKRTLIVVSDGGDNVSELKQADILNLILQSRATVYTVGLLDPEDRDLRPRVLKKFASLSGGEYFQPETLQDVVKVFGKISKDIRSRYTLGFSPDVGSSDRQVHSIKVTAVDDRQKLIVHARGAFSVDKDSVRETTLRDWR
jgi:Ca-activated chloride channel family protein